MSTPSTQSVTEEIRVLIARRNINQKVLSAGADIKPATLSRKMKGEHPFDIWELERIAAYFEVPITDLFGRPKHTSPDIDREHDLTFRDDRELATL